MRRPARVHGIPPATAKGAQPLVHQRGTQRKTGLVVGEKLIDARVRAGRDGAMRGKQAQVAKGPRQPQRGQVVRQRQIAARWLEGDGGRDRRQDVVAGEQQLGIEVGEDDMSPRVPRRGHDAQAPLADDHVMLALQPLVGLLERALGQRSRVAIGLQGASEGLGATQPEQTALTGESHGPRRGDRGERWLLADPQRHRDPQLPSEVRGEGVVVSMEVGHHAAGDVGQADTHLGKAASKGRPGARHGPSGVDQKDAAINLHRIDVDGAQGVGWQGQRHAVHT